MGSETACCEIGPRSMPVLENLKHRRAKIEEDLANVNGAIAALEENPEIEKILTLLGKTGRY